MLWTTALAALAQSVRGVVVDAVTLDTLAHATLQYADQPTPFSADAQGRFSLPRREGHVLRVSSVGYRTERVRITSRTSSRDLIIRLTPSDTQLAEVSVKAKRKKGYKRKGNPAVELMRRVIAAKERTNLERHDFYQYDKYQKITMAINNITPEELQGSLFSSSPWLLGQVEVSEYNNQFVLPISVDETASTHLYRRHPATTRDLVRGQTTRGISKLIQTGDVFNTMAKDIFCDIDLYDDQVTFLQKRFPSPIGSTAISFYHSISRIPWPWRATVASASSLCRPTTRTSASAASSTSSTIPRSTSADASCRCPTARASTSSSPSASSRSLSGCPMATGP